MTTSAYVVLFVWILLTLMAISRSSYQEFYGVWCLFDMWLFCVTQLLWGPSLITLWIIGPGKPCIDIIISSCMLYVTAFGLHSMIVSIKYCRKMAVFSYDLYFFTPFVSLCSIAYMGPCMRLIRNHIMEKCKVNDEQPVTRENMESEFVIAIEPELHH